MHNGSERFVTLAGTNLVLPVEPVELVMALQARGFNLQPDGDDLIVSPFSQLSHEDARQLRRWKYHVLAILEYEAPRCA